MNIGVVAPSRLHRRPRRVRGNGSARLYSGLALGVFAIGGMLVMTQFGNLEPSRTDPTARLLGLGTDGHPLGTDQVGRDMLDRLLAGFRWSLSVGLIATSITFLIGTTVGILASLVRRCRSDDPDPSHRCQHLVSVPRTRGSDPGRRRARLLAVVDHARSRGLARVRADGVRRRTQLDEA